MKCVEIIAVPAGWAPEEVRKAWVGLRLPLSPAYLAVEGMAFGSEGYVVDIPDAVEILELYNKEAATWWRANIDVENPRGPFVFDVSSCRPFDGLPSITTPLGHAVGTKTVRDFIMEFSFGGGPDGHEIPKHKSSIELLCSSFLSPLTEAEQKELEDSALTRPIVLLLSNLVAGDYSSGISGASSEEYFEGMLKEGYDKLRAMHRLAVKYGINVAEKEIDRPLSFIDLGIRAGVIEQVADGGVKLTPKGEAEARRVLGGGDETPG